MIWPKLRTLWSLSFRGCTDNACQCFSIAWNIAETLNHDSILPEHLLAGMIYQSEQSPRTILRRLGVSWDADDLIEPARSEKPGHRLDFDPTTRAILKDAGDLARSWNHPEIGTEHLLLALLLGPAGPAREYLENQGLTLEMIRLASIRQSA
jgi:ATP-dependent Clp protease ATP-binding subunit ClpC